MKRRTLFFLAPVIPLLFLLFIALGGEVVRQLWNWLLPSIFGLREITFWQALGILALSRILFGGFGLQGSGRSRMTTEQRERFRQRMRERFGFSAAGSQSQEP